jgi:3-dehydroquinate dehydratase II
VLAVLNGVNLNLLGKRDPAHYGNMTLQSLESQIYAWAREHGVTARCFQTNHEGEYVEHLHDCVGWATHVIVNPGAWSHYSYAIRDAVEYVSGEGIPVVEVHLSDIEHREAFRRTSVITDVVKHRISGKGPDGYREAIAWLLGGAGEGGPQVV